MKQQSILTVYVVSPWRVENGNLIGPVVAIKEGVLCGSRGCILHSGHILEENAHKFENIPVSLGHPMVDGVYVSIDHNAETKNSIVGVLKNSRYDPAIRGIRGEIHLPANHPRASEIQGIREVSVGVFSDEVYQSGEFNGQEYFACSISYETDHLAILPPGEVGACNFDQDGCGIRVNAQQSKAFQETVRAVLTGFMRDYFKTLTGGLTMNANEVKPMLPPGVGRDEKPDLRKIQQEADRRGILLPTELNRKPESKTENWNGENGEIEPLMPIFN